MIDIVVRALREMPFDGGYDLAHVGAVVLGEAAAASEHRDDLPAGLVAEDSSSPS